jgi:hypothetical protein
VHIDLPTIANIAFKFDGVYQHQNSTVTNPMAGQYGWNHYNRVGGRISALWKPIELTGPVVRPGQGREHPVLQPARQLQSQEPAGGHLQRHHADV